MTPTLVNIELKIILQILILVSICTQKKSNIHGFNINDYLAENNTRNSNIE